MDTQSRCLRLSFSRCRANPDSYTYAKCDADADAYSYADGDPFGYANSNIYSYPDTYRDTQSHAEAAPNTASSSDPAIKKWLLVVSDD